MTPDIGAFLNDVIKRIQRNTFKCQVCDTKIEFSDDTNQYPIFPCGGCGKVSWKIHSINETIIYP